MYVIPLIYIILQQVPPGICTAKHTVHNMTHAAVDRPVTNGHRHLRMMRHYEANYEYIVTKESPGERTNNPILQQKKPPLEKRSPTPLRKKEGKEQK